MKGARVLLVEPVPAELDRLSEVLREAGCKVAAISRADAVLALTRAFRPELVVVGLHGQDLESMRTGKRVHRRFRGTVPTLYVGEVRNPAARRCCFEQGRAIGIIPRTAPAEELLARLRAVLAYGAATEEALRLRVQQRPTSMHDGPTGLYNRAFLHELVGVEVGRAERHGGGFCVGVAELDGFLSLHRSFGEAVCERVMVYAGRLLRSALRESDVLARVGPYHFGVLLPAMGAQDVPVVLERVGRRFHSARVAVEGATVFPRLTAAMASFPDTPGPAERLFARALQELDRAREQKVPWSPRAAV
jgi:two-component system, cell cycle response regulator